MHRTPMQCCTSVLLSGPLALISIIRHPPTPKHPQCWLCSSKCHWRAACHCDHYQASVRLSILSDALLELQDVLLDALVDAALELWAITEGEQDLEPNEEGCQEERLGQVV